MRLEKQKFRNDVKLCNIVVDLVHVTFTAQNKKKKRKYQNCNVKVVKTRPMLNISYSSVGRWEIRTFHGIVRVAATSGNLFISESQKRVFRVAYLPDGSFRDFPGTNRGGRGENEKNESRNARSRADKTFLRGFRWNRATGHDSEF